MGVGDTLTYDKRSEQHYYNQKGINQKGSKYTLDNAQATDLKNLDFFVPNAWTKREGYTQVISPVGLTEPVTMIYEYEKLNGESFMLLSSNNVLYKKTGLSATPLSTGWGGTQCIDALTFVNRAWVANGVKMQSFDGTSTMPFGLPVVDTGATNLFNNTLLNGVTLPFTVMGVTSQSWSGVVNLTNIKTILYAAYRFIRADDYWGPLSFTHNIYPISPFSRDVSAVWQGTTQGNYGGNVTLAISFSGAITPANQGITAIALYLAIDTFTNAPQIGRQIDGVGGGSLDNFAGLQPSIDPTLFRFFTYIPAGFSNGVVFISGITSWTGQILNNDGFTIPHLAFSGMAFNFFGTYTPRYIEISDNRMMTAGFSAAPSSIWFSETGEPEVFEPESVFEVRTNDGDRVTAIKDFQNELMIFKQRSFHKLIGDSPDNYQAVQLSTEYGCLSNKAVVEFNNMLLFLDEKGIVQFTGADWMIISAPIEDVFRRMNVTAALDKAVGVHNALRNQVWFSIPVDGSTQNNLTVVYDYLMGAWTLFDGFRPSSLAPIKGDLNVRRTHMGTYSGMVHHFSPTFVADNGSGFTCYALTKFDSPDGQNVENMYRQLFLDVSTVSGGTGVVDCRVFSNYDSSVVRATFAIYQSEFQTRRDFGVPGKSVGFDFKHFSSTHAITMYGYTVRRRYLRDV